MSNKASTEKVSKINMAAKFENCCCCGAYIESARNFETCFSCAGRFCHKCMIECEMCGSKLCQLERTEDYKCWDCDNEKKLRKERELARISLEPK